MDARNAIVTSLKDSVASLRSKSKGQQLSDLEIPLNVYHSAEKFVSSTPFEKRYSVRGLFALFLNASISVSLTDSVSLVKSWLGGIRSLLRFPINLLLIPSVPELKRIKITTSYFVFQVQRKLNGIESDLLSLLGYSKSKNSSDLHLKNFSVDALYNMVTEVVILHEDLKIALFILERIFVASNYETGGLNIEFRQVLLARKVGPSEKFACMEYIMHGHMTAFDDVISDSGSLHFDQVRSHGRSNDSHSLDSDLQLKSSRSNISDASSTRDDFFLSSMSEDLPPPVMTQSQLQDMFKKRGSLERSVSDDHNDSTPVKSSSGDNSYNLLRRNSSTSTCNSSMGATQFTKSLYQAFSIHQLPSTEEEEDDENTYRYNEQLYKDDQKVVFNVHDSCGDDDRITSTPNEKYGRNLVNPYTDQQKYNLSPSDQRYNQPSYSDQPRFNSDQPYNQPSYSDQPRFNSDQPYNQPYSDQSRFNSDHQPYNQPFYSDRRFNSDQPYNQPSYSDQPRFNSDQPYNQPYRDQPRFNSDQPYNQPSYSDQPRSNSGLPRYSPPSQLRSNSGLPRYHQPSYNDQPGYGNDDHLLQIHDVHRYNFSNTRRASYDLISDNRSFHNQFDSNISNTWGGGNKEDDAAIREQIKNYSSQDKLSPSPRQRPLTSHGAAANPYSGYVTSTRPEVQTDSIPSSNDVWMCVYCDHYNNINEQKCEVCGQAN